MIFAGYVVCVSASCLLVTCWLHAGKLFITHEENARSATMSHWLATGQVLIHLLFIWLLLAGCLPTIRLLTAG